MGLHTLIEWCDSTVNPTAGCTGCELMRLLVGRGRPLQRVPQCREDCFRSFLTFCGEDQP